MKFKTIQYKTLLTQWFIGVVMISILGSCYYKRHTDDEPKSYVLVVHGGAGFADPSKMGEAKRQEYRDALQQAIEAGEAVLRSDGSALDAVESAISVLEDSPLFNAGKGAVFTEAGTNELDASIMEGSEHQAGAVAGVRRIRNPIQAARYVMQSSPHVMLSGAGADAFAQEMGLEMVDTSYFWTQESWEAFQRHKASLDEKESKHGTVGAVALDRSGNLAAGTSTGGMSMKKWGRIGDSPIIGAGTWADNASCAVSCTGHGEYFIRFAAAHEVASRMEHRKWTLERSANYLIHEFFSEKKINGGLIAVDRYGNIATPFNTTVMYRAWVKEGEDPELIVFDKD